MRHERTSEHRTHRLVIRIEPADGLFEASMAEADGGTPHWTMSGPPLPYDEVVDEVLQALERIKAIKQGHPLDRTTQIGPQVSAAQLEKIESYVQIGLDEGAELLIGGRRPDLNGELAGGYYFEPTVLKGRNDMRVFQEEIFGPVVSVTTFADEREALETANDTLRNQGRPSVDQLRRTRRLAATRPRASGARPTK